MAHSLKNQIHYSINQCWKENVQKHSYKEQNSKESSYMIFSFSEAFRLKDVGKDFSNFLKKEHPDLKQIKDISPKIIQDFLDGKTHCSKQTIANYYHSMKKIDMVLSRTYKSYETKFIDIIKPVSQNQYKFTGRGVTNQIPPEDFRRILDYCKQNPSQSSYVVRLQQHLGIRVNELVHGLKIQNIHFDKNELVITNTKAGKILTRQLTPELSHLLKEIIEKKYDTSGNRLFTIENASVNRYLSRVEEKLDILGRYSIHNLRARVAQDYYDSLRSAGFSKNEALQKTSLFLNHRTEREQMLTRSYINVD